MSLHLGVFNGRAKNIYDWVRFKVIFYVHTKILKREEK